ncbi:MAG: hypothetical protein GX649_03515 [Chloroflexi bacterium]|nr:hypothetical protein [Chloroflexota bacterium]
MLPGIEFALWLIIGALCGSLHLLGLRRAVERIGGCEPQEAQRRLARGYPLRVLAWVPVLAGAAVSGLYACVGLVFGLLAGRLATYLYVSRSTVDTTSHMDGQD